MAEIEKTVKLNLCVDITLVGEQKSIDLLEPSVLNNLLDAEFLEYFNGRFNFDTEMIRLGLVNLVQRAINRTLTHHFISKHGQTRVELGERIKTHVLKATIEAEKRPIKVLMKPKIDKQTA